MTERQCVQFFPLDLPIGGDASYFAEDIASFENWFINLEQMPYSIQSLLCVWHLERSLKGIYRLADDNLPNVLPSAFITHEIKHRKKTFLFLATTFSIQKTHT